MRHSLRLFAAVALLAPVALQAQSPAPYRTEADRIIAASLKDSSAWNRIAELTDTFGSRLSGTAALERAIDWTLAKMRADGLENVRGEKVMVPHWVRGAESAELITPRRKPLAMLGLGGSVGTPAGGITAPVLIVTSFDDLAKHTADARGRIVLFDVPFTEYRQTVAYRGVGATAAARIGAVAVLVRSVTPFSMSSPHTGGLRYDSTVAGGPAVFGAPPNRAPIAGDDTESTKKGKAVSIKVLENDADPDHDALTIAGVTAAAHGTAVTSGGTITYTPASGYTGTDTFTYTVSDGRGGTDVATVTIMVKK